MPDTPQKTELLFSGPGSVDLWEKINAARTNAELRRAVYLLACRCQELEARIDARFSKTQLPHDKET
jgi:hypothetical protein